MESKSRSDYPTRQSILFLQAVVVIIGVSALALLLIEPHFEGRNADASLFQIYFNDPFLAYVYIGSIPFFVALFHMFKLLGYISEGRIFSEVAVRAVEVIKYCMFIIVAAIIAALIYLRIAAFSNSEDSAGVIMLGMIATFISLFIGVAASVSQKTLRSAVNIRSENDLTV